MDYDKKRQRKSRLLNRVSKPDPDSKYCRVLGCHNPPSAGTNKGLNQRYCRKHEDFYERHGSYVKRSYTASELNPYRKQAFKCIKAHHSDPDVKEALYGIERLYHQAGPKVEAFRLRGMKPEERARAAWARLREKGVDPRKVLAAWLAVEAIIKADKQPERRPEFKLVQVAKVIHRLASGSHKRWERERPDGTTEVQKLDKYPASRGLVLRHLGRQLEIATGEFACETMKELHTR